MAGTFDVAEFAAAQGLELLGKDEFGVYKVKTADGKEGEFDAAEFLKSNQLDPSSIAIKDNSKNIPDNESVISAFDRARLSLGNEAGKVKFLKSKYEDVAVNANNELVVKNKGKWTRVDPEGFDMGDIADLTDVGVSLLGAAPGAAAGALAGPAASMAAGGATGSVARTTLGRLAGTYEGGLDTQLVDATWDAVISAGVGKALSLGASKLQQYTHIKNGIKQVAEKTDSNSKEFLAGVLNSITKAPVDAVKTIIDDISGVEAAAKESAQRARAIFGPNANVGSTQLSQAAAELKVREGVKFLSGARQALSSWWRGEIKTLADAADDTVKLNVSGVGESAKRTLEGIGLLIKNEADELVVPPASTLVKLGYAADEIEAKSVARAVGRLQRLVNTVSQGGEVTGKQAAKQAFQLNKLLNKAYDQVDDVMSDSVSGKGRVQAFIGNVKDAFRRELKASSPEFAQAFESRLAQYADDIGDVRKSEKLVRSWLKDRSPSLEVELNKMLGNTQASEGTAASLFGTVQRLKGEAAEPNLKRMQALNAAPHLSRVVPRGFLSGISSVIGGAAGGAVAGPVGMVTGALLTQPKVALPAAGKLAQAARTLANPSIGISTSAKAMLDLRDQMLKNPAMRGILQNPQAFSTAIGAAVSSEQSSNQMAQELLANTLGGQR